MSKVQKFFSILITLILILGITLHFMDGVDQVNLVAEISLPSEELVQFIQEVPTDYDLIDGFISLSYDQTSNSGQAILNFMERQEKLDYSYDPASLSGNFKLKGMHGNYKVSIKQETKVSLIHVKLMYQVDGYFAKIFQSLISKVIQQKLGEDLLRLSQHFQKESKGSLTPKHSKETQQDSLDLKKN
ncbi:hypothetical protein MJH12_17300 [bacterium]|nr:hypothetical protein [bacterium]